MKKITAQRFFFSLAMLAGVLGSVKAASTFTITPPAVSNTYIGPITLQISNIPAGDTIVIQKYGDVVTNGMIAPGDVVVQQFNLTDGQAGMVIGGVTNIDVPGDTDGSTNGQITAVLPFPEGDFIQQVIGQYGFVLSSPAGHFAPVTNFFTVTNFPFAQQISVTVSTNGASAPYATLILFPAPRPGHDGPGTPVAGTVANSSGVYSILVPQGTYVPLAFQSNYVGNYSASPVITLTNKQTATANLALTNATASISGTVVDALSPGIVLPGIFVPANNNSGFIAGGYSDTNGNFTIRVLSGQWKLSGNPQGLAVHGYVAYDGGTNLAAGTAGFVGGFYKATALFYGTVEDNLGNPLPGIDIEARDNNYGEFDNDGYSDANGNYVVGAVGGLGSGDPWQIQVSNGGDNNNPTNYLFSQAAMDQNGGTNLAAGSAVLQNFTAILATNQITGHVQYNGSPVAGVQVYAYATIGANNYQAQMDTDTNGNYALNVANGNWNVNVYDCNCSDSDSLNNILTNGNFQPPSGQSVTNNNNNTTANFTIQPCNGIQILTTSPLPAGTNGDYYSIQFAASSCNGNFNWFVNDPQDLPPGLTLYSGGAFNGTSTNTGTYNFSVHVSDGGGNSTNQPFSLTILGKPVLSLPSWRTNQFQMQFVGAANQNYTIQMSTNLSTANWVTLYVTNNPATNSFLLTDPNATNKQRFYRILVGP